MGDQGCNYHTRYRATVGIFIFLRVFVAFSSVAKAHFFYLLNLFVKVKCRLLCNCMKSVTHCGETLIYIYIYIYVCVYVSKGLVITTWKLH